MNVFLCYWYFRHKLRKTRFYLFNFNELLFWLWDHTWQCPEVTFGSALRIHSWQCSGDLLWGQGSNQGWPHARQVPYLFYLHMLWPDFIYFYTSHTQECLESLGPFPLIFHLIRCSGVSPELYEVALGARREVQGIELSASYMLCLCWNTWAISQALNSVLAPTLWAH